MEKELSYRICWACGRNPRTLEGTKYGFDIPKWIDFSDPENFVKLYEMRPTSCESADTLAERFCIKKIIANRHDFLKVLCEELERKTTFFTDYSIECLKNRIKTYQGWKYRYKGIK